MRNIINRHNNYYFPVCIITQRKIYEFSCEFLYFSIRIFKIDTVITNFSVCTEKNTQKKFITHKAIRVLSSVRFHKDQGHDYFRLKIKLKADS